MTEAAAGLPKVKIRGNIVIRKADGTVRLSPHMEANPQEIPAWIVAEMPVHQKQELGL